MSKEKNHPEANGASVDPTSKIEAIRNLIFGENIQEYNSEFESLKKDILQKRKELQGLIEDTRTELMQTIDNLGTDVNIRITELENSLQEKADTLDQNKVDKSTLGKLLIQIGEKIKDN
ncbi:fructose 1,6-bisphosphatase [Sinomicrobium pectinilyticum]|uniref:Fructose 1,6-bisphosphatase n=1 Tax=Sinomicrobium pectinilyticum TaxID=1084421 RepID=A0A3N0EAZ4_SINP1|nr:fructose 1,6-bisphosphatase [Sinomicrobium pectinilyticum]RNL84966.1 fructose 1,6-bisphosphatase [Sinomicrobium pectinilyticum]